MEQYVFRFLYELQRDFKSQHGLNRANYRKLSIIGKIIRVAFKFSVMFYGTIANFVILYISINSHIIVFNLFTPYMIYLSWLIIFTLSYIISIDIFGIAYFTTIFNQINKEIVMIYKESSSIITFYNRIRLVNLTKKHD